MSVSVCPSVYLSVCLSVCRYFMALLAILPPPSTQASSTAIRDMWAQEIRRLLQDQFMLMKGRYSIRTASPLSSLAASLVFHFALFPLQPSSLLLPPPLLSPSPSPPISFPLPSYLLPPPLLSPPPSPPLSSPLPYSPPLFSSPSPLLCRQGDKVWHSEQKYLPWQS